MERKPSSDGITRFPRRAADYPELVGGRPLTRYQKLKRMAAKGIRPPRYTRLSKRMKRIARMIISGMPILDVCKRMHLDSNTYYNWLHFHPLFRKYYYHVAERRATMVEARLDAKLPRAVRILEDSLESRDPYFAAETAVTLLKGRGKLRSSTTNKTEINANVKMDAKVENLGGTNREMAMMFMEAMARVGQGETERVIRPKVIDIAALPPADLDMLRGSTAIQESKESKEPIAVANK